MSSVRRNMRKALYVLLTAALVVSFAFILVACDKDTTETFELTSDDIATLNNAASDSRKLNSLTEVITTETETSAGKVSTTTTLTLHPNNAVYAERTVIEADGNMKKEIFYISSQNYAYALYENGSATPSESIYDSDDANPYGSRSQALEALRHNEILKLLVNVTANNQYEITDNSGTRYYDNDALIRTEYNLSYDDERTEGTISATVTNDVITRLESNSGSNHTIVEYSYETGDNEFKILKTDWFAEHPAP